jgi:uncharacterized protein GlcG (DUF336 family)
MNEFVRIQPVLTAEATQILIRSAVAKAEELGACVNVAVMDSSAQLCGFLRMPGAHLGAVDVALDKAYTSVSQGGRSTREMGQWLAGLTEVTRDSLVAMPRYCPLTGALPIWINGQLVGAIGVSGAHPDKDEACAQSGLAAIGAVLPET